MAILQSAKQLFQLPPTNVDLFIDGRQTYYRGNMEFVDGVLSVDHGGTGKATFEEGNLLSYKDGAFVSSPYDETYFATLENNVRELGDPKIAKADGTLLPRNEQGIVVLPDFLSPEGGNLSGPINYSKRTLTYLDGAKGDAFFNSVVANGKHQMLAKFNSINGVFMDSVYYNQRLLQYMDRATINAGQNTVTYQAILLDEAGNTQFPGKVTAGSFTGDLYGTSEYAYDARALGGKSPAYYLDYINLTNVPDDMDKPVSNAQDAAIRVAVKIETDRAEAAETGLSNALTAESNRAKQAEATINRTIDTNKPIWDDKYTRNEIDNKFSALEQKIDWKESVDTFADIATTYPHPEDGWRVNVKDTDYSYQFDGEKWIVVSANAIPLATQSVNGLLSKEDKTLYDDASAKKHVHSNHALLNRLNDTKLDKVPNVATDDQTPTFEESPDLRELTSGEKLKISFGKLATAVKSLIAHLANKSNPHGVTTAQLHLENVSNTSDQDKPVSTAQQAALDLKAPLASPVLTGTPKVPTATIATNNQQIASTEFVHEVLDDYTENPPFRTVLLQGSICGAPSNEPAWTANGGLTRLPTTYKKGWAYKVVDPAHTNSLQGHPVYDGDLLVAMEDRTNDYQQADWMIVPYSGVKVIRGDDDTIAATSEDGRTYTISHETSTITSKTYTKPNNVVTVPVLKDVTSDECGHLNGKELVQVPMLTPDNNTIVSDANGVLSAKHYALIRIYRNTDLNTLVLPGLYFCDSNNAVGTLVNCPTKMAFTLDVKYATGSLDVSAIQILTEYTTNNPKTYKRSIYHDDGSGLRVGPWCLCYDENNKPPVATESLDGLLSAADKRKINGISASANNYTHPSTSGNKHIPAGGSAGQILRWSADGTAQWGADNNTTYGAATQSAAGLLSAADKKKLDGIAASANKYVHPTGAGNNHIPAGGSAGQILRWSAAGTAVWGADNNTTYAAATTSANGLMTSTDKLKCNLITLASGNASGTFKGSITGNAATATTAAKLGRSGSTGTPMTFNWSGQSGYPSWYWGGSDGTNMYVYNPLNLPFLRTTGGTLSGTLTLNNTTGFALNGGFLKALNADGGTAHTAGVNEVGFLFQPSGNRDGRIYMGIVSSGHAFTPTNDNYVNLGLSNRRWSKLYVQNIYASVVNNASLKNCTMVSTSDRREKTGLQSMDKQKIKGFLKELLPTWYRLLSSPEKQYAGLIAQEVELLLKKWELPEDWMFLHKSPKLDENKNPIEGEYEYGLSYDQLIVPMLLVLQDLL